jgi:hypothetical protein
MNIDIKAVTAVLVDPQGVERSPRVPFEADGSLQFPIPILCGESWKIVVHGDAGKGDEPLMWFCLPKAAVPGDTFRLPSDWFRLTD